MVRKSYFIPTFARQNRNIRNSMDNKKDLSVLRNRSIRACIGDGYQLYVGNFYRIFRSSWVAALLYAVVCGLATSYFIMQYPKLLIIDAMGAEAVTAQAAWVVTTMVTMLCAMLLVLVITAVFASYGVSALAEHQASGSISKPQKWYGRLDAQALKRTLMALGWWVLVALLAGFVVSAVSMVSQRFLSHYVGLGLMVLVGIGLMVVLLPLCYTFMKYLLTPKSTFVKVLGTTYGKGFKRMGAIFMVALVVGLVTALLSCVIELPANILYLANVQSQVGLLQGDPSGMPDYMSWMNLLVFAVAGFIQAYVHLSSLFPFYYLYGKIETDEQERQQQLNNMK